MDEVATSSNCSKTNFIKQQDKTEGTYRLNSVTNL